MELIEIKKDKKQVKVYIRHKEIEIPNRGPLHPKIFGINEEVFNNKSHAVEYYEAVKSNNIMAIGDNETRLVQMPKDALDKVATFADQIRDLMFDDEGELKEKLKHKKELKEITNLVQAHNNRRTFEKNIETLSGYNKEIDNILKELKKLK